jgi:hypothetical protein
MWNILIVNCITNSCIWNTCVNLARYWLQAPWGRHDSVETCRSVIICEIIVHLLVIVQNNQRCTVQGIEITKTVSNFWNTLYFSQIYTLAMKRLFWFFREIVTSGKVKATVLSFYPPGNNYNSKHFLCAMPRPSPPPTRRSGLRKTLCGIARIKGHNYENYCDVTKRRSQLQTLRANVLLPSSGYVSYTENGPITFLRKTLRPPTKFHGVIYLPEGRGFDSRWFHWNFSLGSSFRPHYGPGVDSASKRNEYQEYILEGNGGRCVGLTTLPPSCTDCLEIWEPQPPGTLRACPGL